MYIILHFKRTLVGLQKYCFDTFFQYHFHVFQLIVAGMGISPCKSLDDYWDSFWLNDTKFGDAMPQYKLI